jgi:hypothetical protein
MMMVTKLPASATSDFSEKRVCPTGAQEDRGRMIPGHHGLADDPTVIIHDLVTRTVGKLLARLSWV